MLSIFFSIKEHIILFYLLINALFPYLVITNLFILLTYLLLTTYQITYLLIAYYLLLTY